VSRRRIRRPVAVLAALLGASALALAPGAVRADVVVQIINDDLPGEGCNDPAPWTPTGGNPATTLGQARLNAFQYAANVWGGRLASDVVVRVLAQMNPLTCTPSYAVLGAAGPKTVHRNFAGAPRSNTWYPQALANALAGTDIAPTESDITAQFNSTLNGDPDCLGGASWYYGFDGNPPAGDYDFVTVVMHELGHGLGFLTLVDLETGAKFLGNDDAYMVHLERAGASPASYPAMTDPQRVAANISDPALRWVGGHTTYMLPSFGLTGGLNGSRVRMHAPDPLVPGSSVAHFTTAVTPDEIMEPVFTSPMQDPGLALFVLKDLGWPLDPNVSVVFEPLRAVLLDGAVELAWNFHADEPILGFHVDRRRGEDAREVRVTAASPLAPAVRRFVDADVEPGTTYRYAIAAIRADRSEVRSGEATVTVAAFGTALAQNHPNPFNPATEIEYRLGRASRVALRVYDLRGALVRTLADGWRPIGTYRAIWNGQDDAGRPAPAGAYVARLETDHATATRRMVLLQ